MIFERVICLLMASSKASSKISSFGKQLHELYN